MDVEFVVGISSALENVFPRRCASWSDLPIANERIFYACLGRRHYLWAFENMMIKLWFH
jgi:hypothetical protein